MTYYDEIKNILIDNIVGRKVREYKSNQKDLGGYYNVGKLLMEAQGGETRAKYGNQLIKEYSKRLTSELGKGYSSFNLKNMRKFYLLVQKSMTVSYLLKNINITWSNICEILKLKEENEIEYYLNISSKFNLSTRDLRKRIKLKECDRLDDEVKEKLSKQEVVPIKDTIPMMKIFVNV